MAIEFREMNGRVEGLGGFVLRTDVGRNVSMDFSHMGYCSQLNLTRLWQQVPFTLGLYCFACATTPTP